MNSGVEHTAWNYQSPTISSQSTNDTPREHTSPALVYFLTQQRRTFLLPITTGAPKTQFQPYPTPNITDNYDPITITACFNKNPWTSFCDAFFTLLPNGITTHNIRSQRRQAECSPSSSSVSIFRKFLFHFSTWYHHDTYVFGHLTLGVVHTAWNYQSPTVSSQSTNDTPREDTSPALLYFSHNKEEQNFFTTNHDGRTKNTIPNRIPPPNIIGNYNPINITTFFNKILRLPSAMPSSRYCQTA